MITVQHSVSSSIGEVTKIIITRKNIELTLCSYGASVYSLKFDKRDMTVHPDDFNDFLQAKFYYGKTCGRTSGRLIMPSYQIDGISYPVKPFGGDSTKLHGGALGFSYQNFELTSAREEDGYDGITFKWVSRDGEEDYPGELTLFVNYRVYDDDTVKISYNATTTKDTLCNITNHMYFNLNGKQSIDQHEVYIDSSSYIDLKENLVPIKKVAVDHTAFDYRVPTRLKTRLNYLSKTFINGYDHTWIFDQNIGHVRLRNDDDTYQLDITTNYPAVVLFTHNIKSFDRLPERYGHGIHSAIAVECEYEPGGIHFPDMNSAILRKNETYQHWIDYKFTKFTPKPHD